MKLSEYLRPMLEKLSEENLGDIEGVISQIKADRFLEKRKQADENPLNEDEKAELRSGEFADVVISLQERTGLAASTCFWICDRYKSNL